MQRSKTRYSPEKRAEVFAHLTESDGNIKRTARNTGVPVSTVRDWKTEWENGGVDTETVEALPALAVDFVEDATRIRDKLLIHLERLADQGKLNARETTTGIGVLTDKIRAYKQIAETIEHHHTVEIPALTELEERLGGALKELVAAGQERQRVIDQVIELESSQYRELQPTTED